MTDGALGYRSTALAEQRRRKEEKILFRTNVLMMPLLKVMPLKELTVFSRPSMGQLYG